MSQEQVADALPTVLPPYLHLPCADAVPDPADAVVDYRYLGDGRIALLAYTALDRLHSCCGAGQPWLVLPTHVLPRLREAQPWDSLLLDVPIPESERRRPADGDAR
ncbi:Uncharacterised protein [Rhodococcus gordoniae]|uniref:SseB protein N-terminal domain-containing protein n=1 Tax=Rhodococcus gordoniae TaxID=223392 RepID=A0A379LXP6_9NOCA|nr:SAV_915 family protein [Rhodococcus gordoniae]SUE14809.1 Uncharacterised protein [Rhodococcus gordoniae]